MSSSPSPLRPSFYAAMDLFQNGPGSFYYLYDNQINICDFKDKMKTDSGDFSRYKLDITRFDLDDMAAKLAKSKALFQALPNTKGDMTASTFCPVTLEARFQGGITSGAMELLAKKMATLVVALEESLILKIMDLWISTRITNSNHLPDPYSRRRMRSYIGSPKTIPRAPTTNRMCLRCQPWSQQPGTIEPKTKSACAA
ncbi:hypothetical protein CEP54_013440 [Fusarium duplospermum]|uniref:Uncharacterized protein n=1 Tax=Fusarium duplospermum TaxID=1325734 RepID=A0A428P2U5_9HYPO|nr:hypothetical protein CEP54_013440 [Fusarium duplospermum]